MIVDGVILQKTDTARHFGLTTKKYCVVFLFFYFGLIYLMLYILMSGRHVVFMLS